MTAQTHGAETRLLTAATAALFLSTLDTGIVTLAVVVAAILASNRDQET